MPDLQVTKLQPCRGTILLAEDECLLRSLLSETLNDEGFHVEATASADAAWSEICDGLDFQMLITDVRMPGVMDGLDLAACARKQNPHVPIIVMSGFMGMQNTERRLGTFIAKPFTRNGIMQVIDRLM